MYHYGFAVTSEAGPNEGDVPTWDGEKWVPEPGAGAAATWSAVLEAGNVTGGFSPTISDGDALFFTGTGIISGDDTLAINVANGIVLGTNSLLFAHDVASPVQIGFVDSPTANGTQLRIWGQTALQNGDNGGNVEILAGFGAGNGLGGGLHISPGGSGVGGTNGSLNITNGSGTSMFFLDGDFTPVTASPAITITDGGLKFWDGVAAERPSVTDLPTLLAALDSMGLITDDSP